MNNSEKHQLILKLAGKVIRDRELLHMLSDKVYELMIDELRLKKERNTN